MKIKEKIESECLIAFIHSRLIGLGKNKDTDVAPAFDTEKQSEKAVYIGKYYTSKLEKISSFEKVQKTLSTARNFIVADIYYKSYKKLENIFDKYAPTGSEVIEGLIGLNLLALYIESYNKHDLNIDILRIGKSIQFYEEQLSDEEIYKRMTKLAENIFEDYMKNIGVKIWAKKI